MGSREATVQSPAGCWGWEGEWGWGAEQALITVLKLLCREGTHLTVESLGQAQWMKALWQKDLGIKTRRKLVSKRKLVGKGALKKDWVVPIAGAICQVAGCESPAIFSSLVLKSWACSHTLGHAGYTPACVQNNRCCWRSDV